MKLKDYSQMIGYLTRDKTTDVPGSMAHGLRTGFYDGGRVPFAEAPGSVKTKVVDYLDEKELAEKGFDPNRLLSEMTTEEKVNYFQDLTKKQKIAAGIEKARVSKKAPLYVEALIDFQKEVEQAFPHTNLINRGKIDASKLPKPFAQFLKDRGLNEGTFYTLKKNGGLLEASKNPFFNPEGVRFDVGVETDIAKIRLNMANALINEANDSLKFVDKASLFKDAGFSDADYKKVFSMKSGKLAPLDKAEDKAKKAFDFIFNNPKNVNAEISQLFNPRALMAELTGLTGETISKKFDIEKYDPENYDLYKKLSNTKVQTAIRDRQGPMSLTTFKNLNKTDPLRSQAKATALRKERLDKATTLAGKGVADINAAQKDVVKLLNDHYKKNPEELLGNTKLRNLLDLTLEDGEIVKKNKYVTDDDFKKLIQDKKGLFTMDHVDEVQFEKLSTEFPIFKQLATYNTNSGLIKSMKSYISKNQNSKDPAVKNKIKKQIEFLEDLKLRVDTPTGRVGSKEVLAAVDRKAGILPNFLAQLRALNIKLPKKAQVAIGAIGGLGATTLAQADEVSQRPFPGIKPEGSPTQINPLEEKGLSTGKKIAGTAAGALGVGTKTGRNVLGKAFRTLGTRAAAVPLAGYTVYDNLKKGENVVDATLDPLVGLELMLPNMFKENVSKITSNPTIQKLLKFGKYGRALTPIGAGITAAGLGIDAYKYGKERKQLLDSLTDEQKTELFRQEQSDVVKQQLRGDQDAFDEFSAARGGIASLNVKK